MLDFLEVSTRKKKRNKQPDLIEIYPRFLIKRTTDLMIRGGDFYAIWDANKGMWCTDEIDALALIDRELKIYYDEHVNDFDPDVDVYVMYLWDAQSGMIDAWHKYCQKQMRDTFHMLDEKLIFSNDVTKKEDYASKRLDYPLVKGDYSSYDRLMSVLYDKEERHKIEWAIGSIVAGKSKSIQKFLVLYGPGGTGKSTILHIIEKLFNGYYAVFDAKALGSSTNSFALEPFRANPLVGIQHDGDLSKIEDNTRLNSLVSHEEMTVNEKFKNTYTNEFKTFLFMGTNSPVRITDTKSGVIRRLIDVRPTGNLLEEDEYLRLNSQINFELGSIAYHCKEVFLENPNYYDKYKPIGMMDESNDFFNFVLDNEYILAKDDCISLNVAWKLYKDYCSDANVPYPMKKVKFKHELQSYYENFEERGKLADGTPVRSMYSGFKYDMLGMEGTSGNKKTETKSSYVIEFNETTSILDTELADCLAQYATKDGVPKKAWDSVKSKLSSIDTRKLHYVRPPENHIVVDFDLRDEDGNKSLIECLKAASKFPPTYAEISKGGQGIHLHYIYDGDVTRLAHLYAEHIEIKVFTGKSSLRRKLTKCNDLPIATINSGLPLKGEKAMTDFKTIQSEQGLLRMIQRNLNKEFGSTKSSIDFIYNDLEKAYQSGMKYDVSKMRGPVLAFAANSSHQSDYCMAKVSEMKFKSDDASESGYTPDDEDVPIVIFDIETWINVLIICWKFKGDHPVVKMINPSPEQVKELMTYRLVGFNNRRYDNHIIYARAVYEESIADINKRSQRIINKGQDGYISSAWNISYTDVYDFCSEKQSLKKWEIELGIHHQENSYPWDEPLPEEHWEEAADYCANDVIATEKVFDARHGDWLGRQILADLAGGSVNDTTNTLTTKIIFGDTKDPGHVFTDMATGDVYGPGEPFDYYANTFNSLEEYEKARPKLEKAKPVSNNHFPGFARVYIPDSKEGKYHNYYRGVDVGKGGYVYARPGMYIGRSKTYDIASQHPHSIMALGAFGIYTQRFTDLVTARVLIKHGKFEEAKNLFDGKLAGYLANKEDAKALSQALKIAINSVYGLTAAHFENAFHDERNYDNIVALRGALFMKTLQDEVEAMGFTVIHIKTDSIKVFEPTEELEQFIFDFGKQYGYTFEIEHTWDRICLVNKSTFIGRHGSDDPDSPGEWEATGAQFQVPYVYKNLFSHEEIQFEDCCEVRESKSGPMYLDFNGEKKFIGNHGLFTPVKSLGGQLVKQAKGKNGSVKYDSVEGCKGYLWAEAETVGGFDSDYEIDYNYYNNLVDAAVDTISKFGDFEAFID